ncbi:unspecified monosaccharide ABC transport system [Liquorilactobacillus sucicola DSM 21376 = JCM 15457]|uniref:ABC transporter permease protein n=1 Tax=Liquorilactobacillus sucicola DSM 21376 = JCM 15457 TaxID=1423806 RepID=A0A023CYY9_9LACO|nr:ABC transporter permease [Liquorilactobacillus sucicola]KRN06765.1 ABC transporter permease protein [Liquorilactobacillus sucicola DSM 21376 = JCM 15457]GAJ27039.1 unspecified monosaccharide ABC transport system [Liquorilactobacillus sucicola DSM 21376 = JCM 15457]
MLHSRSIRALAVPLISIIAGFIIGAILMLIFGYDPVQNYQNLFIGSLGDVYSLGETLRNMTPLILTALGFAVSSKAGFFNIGGPGQYLMGWFGSIVFALNFTTLPTWALISGSMVCGALLGGIWSFIAGFLRAYFGTSEVITTIMLNYIALYFVNFAVKNWLAKKGSDSSPNIVQRASLNTDFLQKITNNSTFNWGFFIAIITVFVIWMYFNKTRSGFEVRSVGLNEAASTYAGINVKKTIVIAMLLSGLLAGLGGAIDGIGNFQNISVSNNLPSVGFNGMAVALLAAENPIGIIFAALLFSALQIGGLSISVYSNTPSEIVDIVIASIIFFVGIKYIFEVILTRKWGKKQHKVTNGGANK